MFGAIAKKIFGSSNDRRLKGYRPKVAAINALEPQLAALTDEQLRARTEEFKAQIASGEKTLDDLLVPAFATVREAAKRVLRQRHFDVQLIGGMVLHEGSIAEMRTGEGKTLVATLAVYLNALAGKGVHVVTVNDYLAKRDAEWMGRIYKFLGLTVGNIVHGLDDDERRASYACDITYGTNNEYGFDYLRDNMKYDMSQMVQRGHNFAIVDEVDSILVDEARTPLISFLNNAIKAKALFKRDKEYVVQNGEVSIVDEHTGRILKGRRYNEGLHQAIEAKEGVPIKAENQTMATVTLQNYFLMYDKLSGMTGTAETEAAEFGSTYKLGVVPIRTNKPMQRKDQPDLVYKNEKSKFDQVVEDIVERHDDGQPVLVGTTSVEKSEYLSKLLAKRGVKHEVLNAKNHAREAAIVAQAGRKGAVTVATNMAGRGTDIMLGGNAEFLAVAEMAAKGLDPQEHPDEYEAQWGKVLAAVKKKVKKEAEEVAELGGLYVLGTERHESRRIDNQLRGRSGRQGDPGESRFYLSMTDDLMRLFNTGATRALMASDSTPDDLALESRLVSRAIASAQSQVESRNAEIRKNVLKYDDVLNEQRTAIYGDRRQILEGDDIGDKVAHFLTDSVGDIIAQHAAEGTAEDWDEEALWADLKQLYPVGITMDELAEDAGDHSRVTRKLLEEELLADARVAYKRREEEIGSKAMRELERRVVLNVIDRKWREHLYEMDNLKDGIGLRAMAQRDPLVEYTREGFAMYQQMLGGIREESVGFLYHLEVTVKQDESAEQGDGVQVLAKGLEGQQAKGLSYSAATEDGAVEVRNESGQVNRQATVQAQKREMQLGTSSALSQAKSGEDAEPVEAAPAPKAASSTRAQGKRAASSGAGQASAKPAAKGSGRRSGNPAARAAGANDVGAESRGAFGQTSSGQAAAKQGASAPQNRRQRRAAERANGESE